VSSVVKYSVVICINLWLKIFMNIAQIVPEMDIGGVEQGTYDLARGLREKGHQSIVISGGGRFIPKLKKIGVKHYTLPVDRKSPIVIAGMVKKVKNILQKENIDILHAKSRVPAWIGYFACKNLEKVHFITSFHGFYSPHFFSRIMAKGERVIVVSKVLGRYAKERFKVQKDKLRLVYNGVSLPPKWGERFYPVDRTSFSGWDGGKEGGAGNRIGILARLTPLKGHPFFIAAIARLKEKFPDIKGFIIGPIPEDKIGYKKELEKLIAKLHLKNIHFIPPEQKEKIFPTLNLMLSCSIVPEAFGRSIVEAQLAEIPVIATDVGATPEIIEDRKTGLLVPPKNSEALAEAIAWSFTHREEWKKMTESAKKTARERFSMEQMVNATIKVYQEVRS